MIHQIFHDYIELSHLGQHMFVSRYCDMNNESESEYTPSCFWDEIGIYLLN